MWLSSDFPKEDVSGNTAQLQRKQWMRRSWDREIRPITNPIVKVEEFQMNKAISLVKDEQTTADQEAVNYVTAGDML